MLIRTLALLAAGAAASYFLDPVSGRRRRAQLRDRVQRAKHRLNNYTNKAKDLRAHAHIVVAEARDAVERRRTQRAQPDRRDPSRPVKVDLP